METKFAGYSYEFFPFPSLRPLQTFLTYFSHFCVYTTFVFSRSQKKDFLMVLIALSRLFQRFSVRVKTALFANTLRQPGGEKKRDPGNEFTSFSLFFGLNKSARAAIFKSKNLLKGAISPGFLPSLFPTVLKLRQRFTSNFLFGFQKPLLRPSFVAESPTVQNVIRALLIPELFPFAHD